MIEEQLIQLGIGGCCLAYFIYKDLKFNPKLLKVIENNTIALTKVYEVEKVGRK